MRPRHVAAEYPHTLKVSHVSVSASMRPRHVAAEYGESRYDKVPDFVLQ